ncbi:DUF4386 family protein [Devosia sp.]|uniref:DUF4386 family protein n=1 Tax=Devosia sp. TaxID=1871048 RepID=UPI003A8C99EB
MTTLHRWGALAAFTGAATYIFGFALLATLLAPSGYGSSNADPATIVAFLSGSPGIVTLWNFVIYVVNGIALGILAVALADRLKPHAPALGQTSLVFGIVWTTLVIGAGMLANVGNAAALAHYPADPDQAALLWEIFHTVENGFGGGNEIVGAVWALVLGVGMLRTGLFPRLLGGFSLVIGLAGLSTVIPAAGDVGGAVFGLGYIVWFVWVGVCLLRPAR